MTFRFCEIFAFVKADTTNDILNKIVVVMLPNMITLSCMKHSSCYFAPVVTPVGQIGLNPSNINGKNGHLINSNDPNYT